MEKKAIHLNQFVNIQKKGQLIAKYDGQKEASRKTGIKAAAISACARGKSKHSGGYVWKFNL